MSEVTVREVACPRCGHVERRPVAAVVHARDMPRVKEDIANGTFLRVDCDACGLAFRVEAPFLYVDLDRKHWVAVYPASWEESWRALERAPRDAWQRTMIHRAPRMVRELSLGFVVRAVFGVARLRDKLVAFDAGIHDGQLELLKLELMRTLPVMSFAAGYRPILVAASDDRLAFEVPALRGERLEVDRAALDALEDNIVEWSSALHAVSGGPYVDTGRVLVAGSAALPA